MSFKRPKVSDFPYFSNDREVSSDINTRYLQAGCMKKDCIPSIDEPIWLDYTSESMDWSDDEEVLALIIPGGREVYVAPITVMDYHEIINFTTEEGKKVSLTYCPLCQTAVGYDRIVDGDPVELGVSGLLYNSALILYDRKSLSLFSQVLSRGIIGPHEGKSLTQIPLMQTTLKALIEVYPSSKILSRETGFKRQMSRYGSYPYHEYKETEDVRFPTGPYDSALHPKTLVYKLEWQEEQVIIPHEQLDDRPKEHLPGLCSMPHAGGHLFFEGDQINWDKWIPSLISFYFSARVYYPNARLLVG